MRLRHKENHATYRFFIVPRDSLALLGMQDIELLNILKIMCEVIGDPHESRKFNLQTLEASNGPTYRVNTAPQNKTGEVDACLIGQRR